ncbi:MAG: hypothetical protein AAB948_01825 [Patescibacteria group bacterium]
MKGGTKIVLKKISDERYEFSWAKECGNNIYTADFPKKKERLYITQLSTTTSVITEEKSEQKVEAVEKVVEKTAEKQVSVDNKEYCLTWDSVATTAGSFGAVAGIKLIAASNFLIGIPVAITSGYLIYKGARDELSSYKTDPGCKILGGILGGIGGAFVNFSGAGGGGAAASASASSTSGAPAGGGASGGPAGGGAI